MKRDDICRPFLPLLTNYFFNLQTHRINTDSLAVNFSVNHEKHALRVSQILIIFLYYFTIISSVLSSPNTVTTVSLQLSLYFESNNFTASSEAIFMSQFVLFNFFLLKCVYIFIVVAMSLCPSQYCTCFIDQPLSIAMLAQEFGRLEISLHNWRHSCASIAINRGWENTAVLVRTF